MEIVKYIFQPHGDDRGQLVALEEFKDIPFQIKRVYYMWNTVPGVTRGYHAHKKLEQILICVHGSCKIRLNDGKEIKEVPLEKPYEGLPLRRGVSEFSYNTDSDNNPIYDINSDINKDNEQTIREIIDYIRSGKYDPKKEAKYWSDYGTQLEALKNLYDE